MKSPKQRLAEQLWLLADLERANSDRRSFASSAYRAAVWALDGLPPGLSGDRAELLAVPRIGNTIADFIIEFLDSGELRRLNRLLEELPVDAARISRLPRMTPSRLRMLKRELNIDTVDDLTAALDDGSVRQLPRVGEASAVVWKARLAEMARPELPITRAAGLADQWRSHLATHFPPGEFEIVGAVARLDEWIEAIELRASSLTGLSEFLSQSALTIGMLANPLGATTLTGEVRLTDQTEPLPWPVTISGGDLRGDFHVHSDWSPDGRQTVASIVETSRALGWEYVAITDHGHGLRFGGLDAESLIRQEAEIALVRSENPDLLVLRGAELNIDRNGALDFDDEVLATLDFRLAGVHSNFGLERREQTTRVIAAIEHPLLHAVAHLTGRRIGVRPPIDLDLDAVFAAAAANGTALEVNGHLDRLDISAANAARAAEMGVLFVVNSDAHRSSELDNIFNGVKVLQRAGVTPESVVNTWAPGRLLEWLGVTERFVSQPEIEDRSN